jgi:8-oxo-dGTP pyrophosphatase MutT (NUDIX family)
LIGYRDLIRAVVDEQAPSDDRQYHQPGRFGDHDLNDFVPPQRDLRLAAVLVPVIEHKTDPHVLLTVRSADLPSHSGQVAFPGGKVEKSDGSPVVAALRETEEEVGISRDLVDVVGCLDMYQTGTAFNVLPVVGFVKPSFELNVDTNEVADVFEVPLSFLLDQKNHVIETARYGGQDRRYYAIYFKDYFIWGATAGMIRNLSERVKKWSD